ncbi:MAG: hypothetical protein J2P24_14525 [Streptosporangiales bacterium]|nr:hypothetical protein [Streptosporangiales bacterium]
MTDESAASSWRAGRTRRVVLVAVSLGYAGVASGLRALTWPATVAVLVPAVAAVTLAARRPRSATKPSPRVTCTLVVWGVLVAAGVVWEAWAFFHQRAWNVGSVTHPTLSTLVAPLLHHRLARFGAWLVWLYSGWWLVRR